MNQPDRSQSDLNAFCARLIASALKGDPSAIRELDAIAREQALLVARDYVARLRQGGHAFSGDEDDLVQETMLRAFHHLAEFDGTNFIGWIRRIARNCAIDFGRTRRRRPTSSLSSARSADGEELQPDDYLAFLGKNSSDNVAQNIDCRELLEWVERQLAEYLHPARVVQFWLQVRDGLSLKEIAERCEVTESTVGPNIFKVKRWLQERWREAQ